MHWLWLPLCFLLIGCGARGELPREVDSAGSDARVGTAEECNGLDDDLDGRLDEDYRDELGRYVNDAHCGGCGLSCGALPAATRTECGLIGEAPTCVVAACEPGYARTVSGGCTDMLSALCLPCLTDAACGNIEGVVCDLEDGVGACLVPCEAGCPDGYSCEAGLCQPPGGSCLCAEGESFELACGISTTTADGEALCAGVQTCRDGILGACESGEEVCDSQDNDCDGEVDEDWRDLSGAYNALEHCGACGVDCRDLGPVGRDLVCGGDALSPSCVLFCPDSDDGLDVGDLVDADFSIATGCECRIGDLADVPGPPGASGELLDVNCDGADGDVRRSVYVSAFGDDAQVGSPTRPMRTIGAAIERAAVSLSTVAPRPHVFIASGTYVETVILPDGVQLHGGYRGDFRALDPDGFRVEVRASTDGAEADWQGAALVIVDAGMTDTVVEWITFRGAPGERAAVGALIARPGENLVLRETEISAGRAGIGSRGIDGVPGQAPIDLPTAGSPPRTAVESARNICIEGPANIVAGGRGGANTCGGRPVGGGEGGAPSCPRFNRQQAGGVAGQGSMAGAGGGGGHDAIGPIRGRSCDVAVCCGLADFTGSSEQSAPNVGGRGNDGEPGSSGEGCEEPLGDLITGIWVPGVAEGGTPGQPGSGGGGGGGGSGLEFEWEGPDCGFADGLGGGGGGGGAAGCGGGGGGAGESAGVSIALLLVRFPEGGLPRLRQVRLRTADGRAGGEGGGAGLGALGSAGAQGGIVPRDERTTPSLAVPYGGARGGSGGNGGSGGGGGGGCGGSVVGVWVHGAGINDAERVALLSTVELELGTPGAGGPGGAGDTAGGAGARGEAQDVYVR